MKVVHIITGLGVGGAELMLKRLLQKLIPHEDFDHSVISLTGLGPIGVELQELGVDVVPLNMRGFSSFPYMLIKLRSELKRRAPDIVQTWMYHADFMGGVAAKSLGIKRIIWGVRTTDVGLGGAKTTLLIRSICAFLSKYIPDVIVCAAYASRDFHIKVGYKASKMQVIENGFNLDKFFFDSKVRKKVREQLGVTEGSLLVGSVGRFNEIKNQELFVETASLIVSAVPNAVFLMVGRDNDWDNTQLVDWIDRKALRDKFILVGEQSCIPQYFGAMDVFCLHSKTEGFPNVLGEAMAMGLPCISTDVGDANKLLSDEYLCPSSAQSVAQKIVGVLNLDREVLISIGQKNRKRIVEDYSMDRVLLKHLCLYLGD